MRMPFCPRSTQRTGWKSAQFLGTDLVLTVALGHDALMDYEYVPLRLPQHVDRATATAQLTIAAEYSGWELARVRLFSNGTRQVLLRRRRTEPAQPALSY